MSSSRSLLRRIVDSIADRGLTLRESLVRIPIKRLCRELVSERGEASGTAIAREIAERYKALGSLERLELFSSLLDPYWLADPEEILRSATAYHAHPSAAELAKLFQIAEPRRQELFRRINMGPHGTETVVSMRRDLLALVQAHPELEPINTDLVHLLSSWFNRGFLELRRIDWRTPPTILEKLMEYESVHTIQGWPDLRRRLQSDRRCFAFFHPALPDDPLIFVQIALTRGTPGAIQPLLDIDAAPMEAARADTATFYSINNCLDGLRNISFGAFLLKQVIHELENEDLHLRNFVTLSPIPGFRGWLQRQQAELPGVNLNEVTGDLPEAQRKALTRLCARYLTSVLPSGRAADPVAHFHLNNGASIEQINWMADTSAKGLRQSFGLMANYLYRPARIERNHEQYVKQRRFAVSDDVRDLLLEDRPPAKRPAQASGPMPGIAVESH